MKKILMTIAAAFAAVSMNAQMYVGGSLGFNTSSDKTDQTKEITRNSFSIAPEFGMALDETMGVGILVNFGTSTNKTEYVGTAAGTPSVESTVTAINLKPYLRYQFLKYGKANVFVDGGVNFGVESQKDMKAAMDFGLFVTPGIAYNINETWSIVAKLNDVFRFGYHKDAVADVAGAPDAPTSLDARVSSGGFNLGGLTFGVYYNF